MPRSRSSLAMEAGDALSDLLAAEGGMLGDPRMARAPSRGTRASSARSRVSRGKRRPSQLPPLDLRQRLAREGFRGVSLPRRRRRGVSAANLKGFRKVLRLLKSVGMVPKGLRRHRTSSKT